MKLKQSFDEATRFATDYLAGNLAGNATAQQVLNILLTAGGNAYCDGAAGAYLDDSIDRGDQLVEDLLLHCGVVLEGDAPRRSRAPFTVGGTDEPTTRPVTPRERALVQVTHVRHLLIDDIDPFTGQRACWAVELNRTLELHARAAHAGCRRRALLHLLRTRTDWFLALLFKATGIQA